MKDKEKERQKEKKIVREERKKNPDTTHLSRLSCCLRTSGSKDPRAGDWKAPLHKKTGKELLKRHENGRKSSRTLSTK